MLEDAGAVLDFTDPLHIAANQPNSDVLLRLINVCNILHATNPTPAQAILHALSSGTDARPGADPPALRHARATPRRKVRDHNVTICASNFGYSPDQVKPGIGMSAQAQGGASGRSRQPPASRRAQQGGSRQTRRLR